MVDYAGRDGKLANFLDKIRLLVYNEVTIERGKHMAFYKYDDAANRGYEPTYWEEKGKYQAEYNKLYAKHVPASGESATKEGELLRMISRFYYDRFNNGHCNDRSEEKKYVNSWLRRQKNAPVKSISYNMLDKDLDRVVDFIVEFLLTDKVEQKRIAVNANKLDAYNRRQRFNEQAAWEQTRLERAFYGI